MINILNLNFSPEPLVYLLAALLLGSILGLERTLAHKTAGVRTYGLVSMGSCLFILIARYVIPTVDTFNYDPLRLAAGIVMGVGFLCGGVIVFKDSSLVGLTTAAGLWVAAGIGMAVGYGLLELAIFATLSTLFVFTVFWFIEHKIISRS
ncbi:MAG: MgtC/SapB family protein [bacterium]|nr:MgtC/SapB family protein [bacterium]